MQSNNLSQNTRWTLTVITSRYGRKLLATPPAPYRSLPGPSGPVLEKVSEAVSKQSQNPETVLRLLRTLFRPWGRKGDSLRDFLGFRARRARKTPAREGGLLKMAVQWKFGSPTKPEPPTRHKRKCPEDTLRAYNRELDRHHFTWTTLQKTIS